VYIKTSNKAYNAGDNSIINTDNDMINLSEKVKETIKASNYYFDVQYCHPEVVKDSALERAEITAEEYFANITDEEIEKYTMQSIDENGDEATVSSILTLIADKHCDHSGYETITTQVIVKE